jgi:rubrerythrin
MDFNNDEIRRELRAIDAEHRATIKADTELIDRLFNDEADEQTKWDLLAGGANRSKTFMKVGGVAVLTSAVLAACGSNGKSSDSSATTAAAGAGATTTVASTNNLDAGDVKVLQFAASIENLAVKAYDLGGPLLTDAAPKALAGLFQDHHKQHAAAFNSALQAAGQKPVTEPNASVLAALNPTISGLKTQADVLKFAQALEQKAASTYQSTVGLLKGPKLAYTAMTIGGTEYRHYALLSHVLGTGPTAAEAFLTTDQAIAPQ